MIRKFIILILSTFLLYSCDYKPIYLNKSDINFSIENVNYKGNNEINNIVDTKLKRYKNRDQVKKFNINVNSTYEKISQSKDLTGKTTDYKIIIKITFEIDNNKETITLISQEDFFMKNLDNEFEEKKYEKTKINNSIDIIINTFTLQLSQL
mgnify:CR=1 FL=1